MIAPINQMAKLYLIYIIDLIAIIVRQRQNAGNS